MRKYLNYAELFLKKFYRRLENNTLPEGNLAYFRIFVGLFLLSYILPLNWMKEVPSAFFSPHVLNISYILQDLPSENTILFLQCALGISALCLLLGIYSRMFSIIIFILLTIINSIAFSLGKIDHNWVLISFMILLLSLSNYGSSVALRKDSIWKTEALSVALISIITVFGFFTAGYEKLIYWVDFDFTTSGVLSWYLPTYYSLSQTRFLAEYIIHIPIILLEIVDYIAVIFELTGFLLLIFGRRSWIVFILFAASFHWLNILALNIDYTPHFIVFSLWILTPSLEKFKLLYVLPILFILFDNLLVGLIAFPILILFGVKFLIKASQR